MMQVIGRGVARPFQRVTSTIGWSRSHNHQPAPHPLAHQHHQPSCMRPGYTIRRTFGTSVIVRMARTESVLLDVGFEAPEFALPEPRTGGGMVSLRQHSSGSKATVVMFICNHCPFVVHLKPSIIELAEEYMAKGVSFIAVSSNSVETHPQDGPEAMAALDPPYPFPYVYDATQEVAKAYQAACTPEFMVFDGHLRLQYHGQYDDSRPAKYGCDIPVTGRDIRQALDAVLQGQAVEKPWKPSIGCNIKWTPGGEPAWYGAN